MEEGLGLSASVFDLLCTEDGASLEGAGEGDGRGVDGVAFVGDSAPSGSDDEYIGLMVSMESSGFEVGSGISGGCFSSSVSGESSAAAASRDWLKSARAGAVRWILKTRAYLGFSLRTAYLSVTYLDRFSLRRTVDTEQSWAMQLLSLACLSLAAKMEECRVPALTEFPVEGRRFDGMAIQRMELLVLSTLEWRMSSVTPFLYLNYFAAKLGGELGGRDLFYRARAFIFAAIEGMNFMDYRPSAVAAAAVFVASGQALTRELLDEKMAAICAGGSLEIDQIFSCYNAMIEESRKLQRGPKPHKFLMPPGVESPASASTTHRSDNAVDDPNLSSAGCKRMRLTLISIPTNKNPSD